VEISAILVIIIFILGFFLVINGGSILVESGKSLGEKIGIPPAIIGAGVLCLITTMPEIVVAILATQRADYTLAVGNSLGSMICNFGVVLAISYIVLPRKLNIKDLKSKIILLFVIFLFFSSFIINGAIIMSEGLILLALFIVYMLAMFRQNKIEQGVHTNAVEDGLIKLFFMFFVGGVAIAIGAKAIVNNVSEVGLLLGIDEKIVSLVIVAIGTSLPELVTAVVSAKNGYPEMGIGNMIGANIVNASLIPGICSVIAGGNALCVGGDVVSVGILFLLLISAVTLLPIIVFRKTMRWQGGVLLFMYGIYTTILFLIM